MDVAKCIGACRIVFLIAIAFDITGLVLLFVGIFAGLHVNERFYGDFLIYSGSLIIFASVACWLMWYVGNVRVPEEDGLKKRNNSIVQLSRNLSEKLSQKLKGGEERVKCVDDEECSQVGSPPHKAGKVTWGRSTAYSNEGYDHASDTHEEEKKVVNDDTA